MKIKKKDYYQIDTFLDRDKKNIRTNIKTVSIIKEMVLEKVV